MRCRVVVIGGGPAGMMAAISAAEAGADVCLLEKNQRLGRKLLISGKGRCNLTNDSDCDTFLSNMVGNGKFLYSAYRGFSSQAVMEWFVSRGVPLKTERGKRVFPESDSSADIVKCLERELIRTDVRIYTDTRCDGIIVNGDIIIGVETNRHHFAADCVVIATGGISYPRTGSTGDGYTFAEDLGHTVCDLFPSLVPLTISEDFIPELEGLSLRNVTVTLWYNDKKVASQFGELVFTSDGISGPVVLTLSRDISRIFTKSRCPLKVTLDFKPALDEKQLDTRILRDFEANQNKNFGHLLELFLPHKMIPVFQRIINIPESKKIHDITKVERKNIRKLLKEFPLTVIKTHSSDEAIVTAGGISVKEINPKTMMSRICPGLFFAGEVMDIDGYTGGFNIQAALCSGKKAGENAAVLKK